MAKASTNSSRFSFGAPTNGTAELLWEGVDPGLLMRAVVALSKARVGLTLSTTRKGDAVSLSLLDGGAVSKAYPATTEEIEALLEAICIQADLV